MTRRDAIKMALQVSAVYTTALLVLVREVLA